MNRAFTIILVFAIVASAFAANAGEKSKEFRIERQQVLSGFLTDPAHARIANLSLDLLSRNPIVSSATTNEKGEYAFGEVAPGKYRIRVNHAFFRAPRVNCTNGICTVEPVLYVINVSYKNCKGPCL